MERRILTEEDQEALAVYRARLDAELELTARKQTELRAREIELTEILNIIDKIIDSQTADDVKTGTCTDRSPE